MPSFDTILGRLGELGAGYLTGTQEREDEARAERTKMVTTGLTLGASGIDASKFFGPDTVSRDNRSWFGNVFQNMGGEFVRPYREGIERQLAAQDAQRKFDIFMEDRRQAGANQRASLAANATLAAAAVRSQGDRYTVTDELRLNNELDTEIARNFARILSGMQDDRGNPINPYAADGSIAPEFKPALAELTDKLRPHIGSFNSLAEMQNRVQQAMEIVRPGVKVERTDSRANPFSDPAYSVKVPTVTPNDLFAQHVQMAGQAVMQQSTPAARARARTTALDEIGRRYGPDARARAEAAFNSANIR